MLYFPCGLAVGELNTCFPLRLEQISWDLCSSIPWDQLNFKGTLLTKQECKRWKTPLKWVSDSSVLGFLFQYDIWSPVNANIVTFQTNITSLIPARLQRDSWCHSQVISVHGSIISWSDISSPSTTYMWLWKAGIGTINIYPWQSSADCCLSKPGVIRSWVVTHWLGHLLLGSSVEKKFFFWSSLKGTSTYDTSI